MNPEASDQPVPASEGQAAAQDEEAKVEGSRAESIDVGSASPNQATARIVGSAMRNNGL